MAPFRGALHFLKTQRRRERRGGRGFAAEVPLRSLRSLRLCVFNHGSFRFPFAVDLDCIVPAKKPPAAASSPIVNTDIYLLRDGKEIGPFSEETTHSFLKQGAIQIDDLAWTPGLTTWSPLVQVLYPAATHAVDPEPVGLACAELAPVELEHIELVPVESLPAGEPATQKQKAFLTYLGVPFSNDTTKEHAALLVNEAMENPALNARVLQWNDDRLTLHPELFAAEAKAKKDDRVNRYFESCQREGADRFAGVTKAHCQVIIGYLDVSFPNWDANESEAAWNYFFPAVAEKFPEFVRKAWRGKLKLPNGPKVAPEIVVPSRFVAPRARTTPVAALVRGIIFGLALLLALYIAVQVFSPGL